MDALLLIPQAEAVSTRRLENDTELDEVRSCICPAINICRISCVCVYLLCLSSGLRPLKDSVFVVCEGESFRDLVNLVSSC